MLCRLGLEARKPELWALRSPARPEPSGGLERAYGSGLDIGRPEPGPRARALGAWQGGRLRSLSVSLPLTCIKSYIGDRQPVSSAALEAMKNMGITPRR